METSTVAPGSSWNENRLSARLGIDYPIIQGPLGGLSTQRLTAAVSNFGGLGSFGAVGLEPDAIRAAIAEVRALTSRPFAVNLWVSVEDEAAFSSDRNAFEKSLSAIAPHLETLGGSFPSWQPYVPLRFEDQARVLIDARVPVFSFIFGIPPKEMLDDCRAHGIVTMGTATTPDEAAALQQAGVDVIVASGFEAGGHRGSFLRSAEESLTGTFSLVPQIADRVDVPVVAAGGVADGRGVVAALALGADGVQIGTAFLACDESGASAAHRDALRSSRARRTGLTKGFTGRLARSIENQLLQELNRPGVSTLPYPLQRMLMRNLTVAAEKAARPELVPMWAGQSATLSRATNATEFMSALVSEISSIAPALLQWKAARG